VNVVAVIVPQQNYRCVLRILGQSARVHWRRRRRTSAFESESDQGKRYVICTTSVAGSAASTPSGRRAPRTLMMTGAPTAAGAWSGGVRRASTRILGGDFLGLTLMNEGAVERRQPLSGGQRGLEHQLHDLARPYRHRARRGPEQLKKRALAGAASSARARGRRCHADSGPRASPACRSRCGRAEQVVLCAVPS
jgi:hypothetical protein